MYVQQCSSIEASAYRRRNSRAANWLFRNSHILDGDDARERERRAWQGMRCIAHNFSFWLRLSFFYSCFSALSPGVFSAAQLRPNEFLRCELTLNYARARGEPGNFLRAPDLQWPLTRRMCAVYAHDISILDLRVCARTRSRHTRSRSRLLNVE